MPTSEDQQSCCEHAASESPSSASLKSCSLLHPCIAEANPRFALRSTEELLLAAPKVELHVHLDGSFDAGVLFRAAQAHLEAGVPNFLWKQGIALLLHPS